MAFFDDFTSALKQKWLQYYQLNHSWLALQMEVENVKTPDGGRRPSSYLILGVLNALEPKLAQLMLPFSRLNSDPDSLIEVLELNFDPDVALGKRPPMKAAPATPSVPTAAVVEPTTEPGLDDLSDFSDLSDSEESDSEGILGIAVTETTVAVGVFPTEEAIEIEEEESDLADMDLDDLGDEPNFAVEESSAEALDDIGSDDFAVDESLIELSDDESDEGFADISLDAFGDTSDTEELSDTSDSELSGLTDVWGSETSEELSEESLADFGDLSLDDFGSELEKKSDDDDEDAFGSLDFDPFADPNQNSLDDEWK